MTSPRKPWLAALLSVFCDGLGHFYCGRVGAALLWAVVPMASILAVMSAGLFVPRALPALSLVALVMHFGARLAQAVLVWRLARGLADYQQTRLNSVPVYVAIFLVSWLSGGVFAQPFRSLALEPFKLPGDGMNPTLLANDQVFVLKAGPHSAIRRGDVVVYTHASGVAHIKRIVGIGGDTVELRSNALWLNGEEVPGGPCETPSPCWREGGHAILADRESNSPYASLAPQHVPAGHVFVLGDWRDNSDDSRVEGPIPEDRIIGRAAIVWLSIDQHLTIQWDRIGIEL